MRARWLLFCVVLAVLIAYALLAMFVDDGKPNSSSDSWVPFLKHTPDEEEVALDFFNLLIEGDLVGAEELMTESFRQQVESQGGLSQPFSQDDSGRENLYPIRVRHGRIVGQTAYVDLELLLKEPVEAKFYEGKFYPLGVLIQGGVFQVVLAKEGRSWKVKDLVPGEGIVEIKK